jgi:type II secretory pathway pseudopilin PulG
MSKKNNSGFGIVEVLVAIGLVAIMAVGITSMLTGAMKSQKGIQAKDQQRDLTSEIRALLNDNNACKNSFNGGNPSTGFTKANIINGAGVTKYSIPGKDKTGMLNYEEFRVDNWVADASSVVQGRADLKIKLSKVGDTGTAKDIKPDVITLKVTLSGAGGTIVDCFSIGMQSDGFWKVSPANSNNIYYNAGNVGIGTTTPGTGVGRPVA